MPAAAAVPAPALSHQPLLNLSPGVDAPVLFCVHGGTGDASFYAKLGALLDGEAAIHAIQYPAVAPGGARFAALPALARHYVQLIRKGQPNGPYRLAGWSFGGLAVYEMARELREQGEQVSLLCMFDALIASGQPPEHPWGDLDAIYYFLRVKDLLRHVENDVQAVREADASTLDTEALLNRALALLKQEQVVPETADMAFLSNALAAIKDVIFMSLHYRPDTYEGDVVYVGAMDDDHDVVGMVARWRALIRGEVDLLTVPMRHNRMFDDVNMPAIAAIVRKALARTKQSALA